MQHTRNRAKIWPMLAVGLVIGLATALHATAPPANLADPGGGQQVIANGTQANVESGTIMAFNLDNDATTTINNSPPAFAQNNDAATKTVSATVNTSGSQISTALTQENAQANQTTAVATSANTYQAGFGPELATATVMFTDNTQATANIAKNTPKANNEKVINTSQPAPAMTVDICARDCPNFAAFTVNGNTLANRTGDVTEGGCRFGADLAATALFAGSSINSG